MEPSTPKNMLKIYVNFLRDSEPAIYLGTYVCYIFLILHLVPVLCNLFLRFPAGDWYNKETDTEFLLRMVGCTNPTGSTVCILHE